MAAEMDEEAAHCTQAVMPQVVPVRRVEDLRAVDFIPMLVRRSFRGVLLGGGSPCQGNSALNRRRKGLADTRSQQPLELQRLVSEFELGRPLHASAFPSGGLAASWQGCDAHIHS